jgi:hypothetical protein
VKQKHVETERKQDSFTQILTQNQKGKREASKHLDGLCLDLEESDNKWH